MSQQGSDKSVNPFEAPVSSETSARKENATSAKGTEPSEEKKVDSETKRALSRMLDEGGPDTGEELYEIL